MARSAITPVTLSDFNSEGTITKDAFDATNDHSLDVSSIKDNNLVIFIETTNTVAVTIDIKAGDFSSSTLGDVQIVSGAIALQAISIETARFKDNDGLILIDVTGTGAGNLYAAVLP